jgi:hypothetical protein
LCARYHGFEHRTLILLYAVFSLAAMVDKTL